MADELTKIDLKRQTKGELPIEGIENDENLFRADGSIAMKGKFNAGGFPLTEIGLPSQPADAVPYNLYTALKKVVDDLKTAVNSLTPTSIQALQDSVNALTPRALPSGGANGQVLAKKSGTNYDTIWATPSGGSGGSSDYNALTNKPDNPVYRRITEIVYGDSTDCNNLKSAGVYQVINPWASDKNGPYMIPGGGTMTVLVSRDTIHQMYISPGGKLANRHCYGFAGSGYSTVDQWSAWTYGDLSGVVRGSHEQTRAERIPDGSVLNDRPSGFYSVLNDPNMPDTGWWYIWVNRHENGSSEGNSGFYNSMIAISLSSADFYYGITTVINSNRIFSGWKKAVVPADVITTMNKGLLDRGGYLRRTGALSDQFEYARVLFDNSALLGGVGRWPTNLGDLTTQPFPHATHPGLTMIRSENSFGRKVLATEASILRPATNYCVRSEWLLSFPTTPNDNESFSVEVGFVDGQDLTNGVYMQFVRDSNGFSCYGCMLKNGTVTKVQLYNGNQFNQYINAVPFNCEVKWTTTQAIFHIPGLFIQPITDLSNMPTVPLRHGIRTTIIGAQRPLSVNIYRQECNMSNQ